MKHIHPCGISWLPGGSCGSGRPWARAIREYPNGQGARPRPRRWLLWASGSLAIMAGCAELPGSAQVAASAPPVPSGEARVWFYRPLEPSESLNLALIDMNGSYVAAVANGSAFYRDVSPGVLSHRASELGQGLQPGQECRTRSRPAGLR